MRVRVPSSTASSEARSRARSRSMGDFLVRGAGKARRRARADYRGDVEGMSKEGASARAMPIIASSAMPPGSPPAARDCIPARIFVCARLRRERMLRLLAPLFRPPTQLGTSGRSPALRRPRMGAHESDRQHHERGRNRIGAIARRGHAPCARGRGCSSLRLDRPRSLEIRPGSRTPRHPRGPAPQSRALLAVLDGLIER